MEDTSRVGPRWRWAGSVVVLLLASAPAAMRLPGAHGLEAGAWHLGLAAVHAALLTGLVAWGARRGGARWAGALGLGLLATYVALDARCFALSGLHLPAGGWRALTAAGR